MYQISSYSRYFQRSTQYNFDKSAEVVGVRHFLHFWPYSSIADKMYRENKKLTNEARTEEKQMKVHEKMGDVAANTGLYKTAIKYYQKMVSYGLVPLFAVNLMKSGMLELTETTKKDENLHAYMNKIGKTLVACHYARNIHDHWV